MFIKLEKDEGCVKIDKFWNPLLSCVRMYKTQGAKIADEGSVQKYVTESKIDKQHSGLCIITRRLMCLNTVKITS